MYWKHFSSQDVSKALDELEKKEAADIKSGDEAAAASGDEEDKGKDDEEAEKKVQYLI